MTPPENPTGNSRCDLDGAPSRAVKGHEGSYCSTGCMHAAECRGDGTCCSDGAEDPTAVNAGKG